MAILAAVFFQQRFRMRHIVMAEALQARAGKLAELSGADLAAAIAEYVDEIYGAQFPDRRLLPKDAGDRIEVRRLMSWFNDKFFAEVSGPLTTERSRGERGHRSGEQELFIAVSDDTGFQQHRWSGGGS